MNLRSFTPPVVFAAISKIRKQTSEKYFKCYEQALAECSIKGYENPDLVSVIVSKTIQYRDSFEGRMEAMHVHPANAYLFTAIASMKKPRINVLDFGGAAGAHYFFVRKLLPKQIELNWVVVETNAMAERAKIHLSNNELQFCSNLDTARSMLGNIHLLHTSGTLQCVDNPYSYLRLLLGLSAESILFNRLGFTKGSHDVITIHTTLLSLNGPGKLPEGVEDKEIKYPFTFPMEQEFRRILDTTYEVKMILDDSSGIFTLHNETIVGYGLLASLRN